MFIMLSVLAENCVRLPYILVTAVFTGLIKGFIDLAIDYLLKHTTFILCIVLYSTVQRLVRPLLLLISYSGSIRGIPV